MQREEQDRSNETTKYEIPRPNRFFFIYSKIDYEDNFFKKNQEQRKFLKNSKQGLSYFKDTTLKSRRQQRKI